MSLFNMSSLRGILSNFGKTGKKTSKSEQLKRHLALDNLEDRVLLTVTPSTVFDIQVNQEVSANQSTNTNGSPIAVDDDGDTVVTWTRSDVVYQYTGAATLTYTEDGIEYKIRTGDVGLYNTQTKSLTRLFTQDDAINKITGLRLAAYTDENGNPVTDDNVYARYLTDEVQRLAIDTSRFGDGNYLQTLTLAANTSCVQRLKLTTGDQSLSDFEGTARFVYSFEGNTYYSDEFDLSEMVPDSDRLQLQNAKNIKDALENFVVEGQHVYQDVQVTVNSSDEYLISYKTILDENDNPVQNVITAEVVVNNSFAVLPTFVGTWVTYPTNTRDIQVVYTEGADGKLSVNMAATAANIQNAINTMRTTVTNAPDFFRATDGINTDDILSPIDRADYGSPKLDPEMYSQSTIEVSVVPVELENGLIGFDITFVNSSGLQDMPELSVKTMTVVPEADIDDFSEDSVTYRYNGSYDVDGALISATDTVDKYYDVTTLKQSSGEFRVNGQTDDKFNRLTKTYTATAQNTASVAMDSDGDFAITWTSEVPQTTTPGSFSDIYARTYTPKMVQTITGYTVNAGKLEAVTQSVESGRSWKATSDPFVVNSATTGPQKDSAIAVDDKGNFVIVWASNSQEESYANSIYMQRYDSNGNRVGSETRVDTEQTLEAYTPQVAVSSDGKYIGVTWSQGNGLGANASVLLAVYNVNDDNSLNKIQDGYRVAAAGLTPSISFNESNQFAVSWTNGGDTFYSQFVCQNGGMTVLRTAYHVNNASLDGTGSTDTWNGVQEGARVAMDADGDIVVSYHGNGPDVSENALGAGTSMAIFQQMMSQYFTFDDDGNPIGVNADIYDWLYGVTIVPMPQNAVGTSSTLLGFFRPGDLMPWMMLPGDVDTLITAFLAYAQQGGATADQLGRMNNILRNTIGKLSGEYVAAMFSMYDADQTQTQTLYTDSVANAHRDGKNASCYVDIVDMAWRSYTLGINVEGKTYTATFNPVFETNAAGETIMNVVATASAMKAAIQNALLAEGDSWRVADQFEGIVEVIPYDEYVTNYDGSDWEYDTRFRNDDWLYHTFMVEFQGSVHDYSIEVAPAAGTIATSQIQTIQVVADDYGYFWLQKDGAAMTATTPLIYWDGNFNALVGSVRTAIIATGYDQGNFRIVSDPDELTITITWVAGEAGHNVNLVAVNSAVPVGQDGKPIRTVTGDPVVRVNNDVLQGGQTISFPNGIPMQYSNVTTISPGVHGTGEYGTGIGVQPNGSFVYVWSQSDLSSIGNSSLANLYVRKFTESQDDAGPEVLDYYYTDGTKVVDGKQLTDLSTAGGLGAFVVTFSENMMDSTTMATPTNNLIAASVTNANNWILMKDGVVVDNAIKSIEFGMNRSADADMQALGVTAIGENKWEAVVLFNDDIDLADGTYQLVATNGMYDRNGNPLGKTGLKIDGENSSRSFNIIVGSDATEEISEPAVLAENQNLPSPVSTASDYEGDHVTVWKDAATGQIKATVSYVKWEIVNGERQATNEGEKTLDITSATLGKTVEYGSVAMAADGNFVVTWSQNDGTEANPDWNVYFAMFDLNGTVLKDATMANSESTTTVQQRYSNVDISLSGEFVIVWQSYKQDNSVNWDIYGQIYDRGGNALGLEGKTAAQGGSGKEFLVNEATTTSLDQQNPTVAIDNFGNFVVTWTAMGQGTDTAEYSNIVARRFQKDTTLGSTATNGETEFIVNEGYQTNNQKWASVDMDADGDFVVTWTSYGQDGTGNGFGATSSGVNGVYAQRYDKTGAAVNGMFLVNTTTENDQQKSKVSVDADGDFIIAWESYQEMGDGTLVGIADNWGVYTQRYVSVEKMNANATLYGVNGETGGEFMVYESSHIGGNQTSPSVAMTHTGDYFIAWQSDETGQMGVYHRSTYRPTDDTGSVVVRVLANTTNHKSVEVTGKNTITAAVRTLDVVMGEQLLEGISAASITNVKNWSLVKDGEEITSQIKEIKVVGYAEADAAYPNGTSQKDIYRIILDDGTVLSSGRYTLTIYSDVTDLSGNYLDGNADGKSDGDYSVSFIIEETAQEENSLSNSAFVRSDTGNTPTATVADASSISNNTVVWTDTTGVEESRGLWIGAPTAMGYDVSAVQIVNDLTARFASLAITAEGDYIVTWTQEVEGRQNIYVKVLNDDFTTKVDTQKVNVADADSENSQVAVFDDGTFVVVWEGASDTTGRDIYARRFNADGTPASGAVLVNNATADQQYNVTLATNADGKSMVSWTSNEGGRTQIYAKVYNSDGTVSKSDFMVSSSTGNQDYASVGLADSGDFVVVWTESNGTDNDVWARRFGSDNLPMNGTYGDAFLVNDTVAGEQKNAKVAINEEGNFAIVWQSVVDTATGEKDWNIMRKSYLGNESYLVDQLGNHQYGEHGEYSREIEVIRQSGDSCYSPNVTLDGTTGTVTWQEKLNDEASIFSVTFDLVPAMDENEVADGNGVITVVNGWTPVATAMDYEGDMVSVWSESLWGGGTEICAKIDYIKWDYTNGIRSEASQGSPTTKTVSLTTVNGTAEFVSVAMDDAGDFVVTWSQNDGTAEVPDWNIYAILCDLNGTPKGEAFRVNTTTYSQQRYSSVSMSSDGQFVVTWQSYQQDAFNTGWDIYAKKYDADGNVCSIGSNKKDYLVNARSVDDKIDQQYASVAMDAVGNFVVSWTETVSTTSSLVYARVFRDDTVGDQFVVSEGYDFTATGTDGNPIAEQAKWSSVAMDRDGDFVITWTSKGHEEGSSKTSNGVFFKKYSAYGAETPTAVLVNTTEVNDQQLSRVAMDASGDFVISWESYQDGDNGTVAPADATNYGVFARSYASDATTVESEIRVNTTIPGNQRYANVVMDHTGDYVVTWYSDVVNGQAIDSLKRYKKWSFKRDPETNKVIDDTGNVVVTVHGVDTDSLGNEVKTRIDNGDVIDKAVTTLEFTFGEQIDPNDPSLDSVLNLNSWIIKKDGYVISSSLFIKSIELVGYNTMDTSYANNVSQKDIIRLTFNEEYLSSEGLENGEYEITLSERAKDIFGNLLDGNGNGVRNTNDNFTLRFTLAAPTADNTDKESDVTPDTNYDVLVNQKYSQNQSTATNGNSIAVDDDGDIIATWTRGDNVYYYSGGTVTFAEGGKSYTVKDGDVGLVERNADGVSTLVRLFTEQDFVTYADEMAAASGQLNKYIDPSSTSGKQLVDYNVYARYLTDEVQRLVIDTTAAGDGNSIHDMVLSTGGNGMQKISFTSIEALAGTPAGPIYSRVTVGYGGEYAEFDYYENTDIVQTYQNAARFQAALESIFGEDNVVVTPTSSCEFTVEFVSNKNGGTTPTSLIEIQLTDVENPDALASEVISGATASWIRKPVTTGKIAIQYNADGSVNLAATSALIEKAFNVDAQTNYAESPTLFRSSRDYGTHSYDTNLDADTVYTAPATSPNVVQDPIIEVSVTAVEGLKDGFIGFDITFTGISGKQDMPELVVESIHSVATSDLGDSSAEATAVNVDLATNLTTIKECSDEFRVNPAANDSFQRWNRSYVPTSQSSASVAVDSDGNFVISWTSEAISSELPGSVTDIYARAFTPQMKNIVTGYEVVGNVLTATLSDRVDGTCMKANGDAFRVNDTYTGPQSKSSVSMDDAGNLAVVWQSGSTESAASNGIYMKVYSNACWTEGDSSQSLTDEIRVDGVTEISLNPVVAMSPDGQFIVVAWESDGLISYSIYGQTTDAAGKRSYTQGYSVAGSILGHFPSIAFTNNNLFAITSELESVDANTGETLKSVYLSQFKIDVDDTAGITCTVVRDNYRVNSSAAGDLDSKYWPGDQSGSTVAMDANGNIIVSYEGSGVDTSENVVISSSRMRQLLMEYFSGLNEDLAAFVDPNNFTLVKDYEQYSQLGSYFVPNQYLVVYRGTSGETIRTSGDPDALLKAILVDAQKNGATDEQLGRLYAVLNNVFSTLRGESNGALFTIYDSASTATETVYSDSIANARRDGSNSTFYIKLDSRMTIQWTTCELYVYNAEGGYTSVSFEPVYEEIEVGDDTFARLLVQETRAAIAAALNDALFSGSAWNIPEPDAAERAVEVRSVNLNDYTGTYWDPTGAMNMSDDADYVVYEVTFQGSLHDAEYGMVMNSATATIGDNEVSFRGNGNRIGAYTVHMGSQGTEQHDISVGMTSNGSFSFLWTENDLTSYGAISGQSIYTRTFTQTQDTANPLAKELWYSDADTLEYVGAGQTVSVGNDGAKSLIVVFNEEMLNYKTLTNLDSDPQKLSLVANSVTNPQNWVLVKDGTEVICGAIESIEFGMNRSADLDMQESNLTALAENKWEAVIVLKDGLELDAGSYELRLAGNVVDVNGNAAGDQSLAFVVDAKTTPGVSESMGDGTFTTTDSQWVPNATASDDEGDTVTVYNVEGQGLWATISYAKWESNPRAYVNEGSVTIQITDDPTAEYASVAMDGSGNFVVVWQQDDGDDNGGMNIHASLFDLNGVGIREDFVVNNTTDDVQKFASVAMDLDGDFVVTWQSKDQTSTGYDWNIRAQRYDADGSDFGGTSEIQAINFLEGWSGDFNLSLNVEGVTYETGWMTSSGNTYGTVAGLQAALDKMSATINAAGGAQYVFEAKATGSSQIQVKMIVDGGSWDTNRFQVDYTAGAKAKSGVEITVQQEGTQGEFMVNETVIYDQTYASVDMDDAGNFVISWTNTNKDKTTDIFARQFYSNDYLRVDDATTIDYIRTQIDPTEMEASFASGVGLVLIQTEGGVGYGTGSVLKSGRHVLTAAHVVTENGVALDPSNVFFRYYNSEGWHQVRIVSVTVNPAWDGTNTLGDVAVIELEESLLGQVTTYDINRDSSVDVGSVYTRYGYGLIGDPETGAVDNMDWDSLLAPNHRGMNKWDAAGSDLEGTQYSGLGDNLLVYDYDSGLAKDDTLGNVLGIKDLGLGIGEEACGAHGDSGGPCLVNGLIYGICQGGFSDTSDYGTIGMDTRISYYADWIDGIVANTASTSEFLVNSLNTTGMQTWSSVAVDADGDFVVTWTSSSTCMGTTNKEVYVKRYDASCVAKADEFQVGKETVKTYVNQQWSKVAIDADGDFIVTWEENLNDVYEISTTEKNNWDVYVQAYNADGTLKGDLLIASEETDGDQRFTNVAMDACGDYIVTWNDLSGNQRNVTTRRFNLSVDYTAPKLVRITTDLDASQHGTIFGNGAQLESGLPLPETLYFVFDEEMNVSTNGDHYANSVLNPKNWTVTRNGVKLLEAVESITVAGYDETGSGTTYPFYQTNADGTSTIEKNIFSVVFKDGTFDESGTYIITLGGMMEDEQGNKIGSTGKDTAGVDQTITFTLDTGKGEYEEIGDAEGPYDDRVNTYTAGNENQPVVAMDANGNYVVVWVRESSVTVNDDDDNNNNNNNNDDNNDDTTSPTTLTTQSIIVGQRFDRYGNKITDEFYISDVNDGLQYDPSIAMDQFGNFVVSWTAKGMDTNADGLVDNNEMAEYDVYARVFSPDCLAVSDSFVVSSTNYGMQTQSCAAIADDGSGLVVTWTNRTNGMNEIHSQRFTFAGRRNGSEIKVNASASGELSAVAMDGVGNIVVAWTANNIIYMQKFDANNTALSGVIRVNQTSSNDAVAPDIAMNDAGDIVVGWESSRLDGSGKAACFRTFNSNLEAISGERYANQTTANEQYEVSVAIQRDAENGKAFLVSWTSFQKPNAMDSNDSRNIFARKYDDLTATSGTGQFLVNSYTLSNEIASCVAMDAWGNGVVVWTAPDAAATGDKLTGSFVDASGNPYTDIYSRNLLSNDVPNYTTPRPTVTASAIRTSTESSANRNYSALAYGGGHISTNTVGTGSMTISAAKGANNVLVFRSTSTSKPTIQLNGAAIEAEGSYQSYTFDASTAGTTDNAVVVTGQGGEVVTLNGDTIIVRGKGYTLTILNADCLSEFTFDGTGDAQALFTTSVDGTGSVFTASGKEASLATATAILRVTGCSVVTVSSKNGKDKANLTGTSGADTFTASESGVQMKGTGYVISANDFAEVYAAGGLNDTATFTGSTSNTLTYATGAVTFQTGATRVVADSFATSSFTANGVTAAMEAETLEINGSTDLVATGASVSLAGTAFDGFTNVTVSGNGGKATLYDTKANDKLTVDDSSAQMSGKAYSLKLDGFNTFVAYSVHGGKDSLTLGDTAGDDTFVVNGDNVAMNGNEFDGFDTVKLLSTSGNDALHITGTDAANKFTLSAGSVSAKLGVAEYTASGFADVAIDGKGGMDALVAYDTKGDDTFTMTPGSLSFHGEGYQYTAENIATILVNHVNGGNDVVKVTDSTEKDTVVALPEWVTMISESGQTATASGFANVEVISVNSTDDTAVLFDSVGDDLLEVTTNDVTDVPKSTTVTLSGTQFFNSVAGFRRYTAYSLFGGRDTAKIYNSVFATDDDEDDDLLSFVGDDVKVDLAYFDEVINDAFGE